MNKLLTLLVSALLCVSLIGCVNPSEPTEPTTNPITESVTTEPATQPDAATEPSMPSIPSVNVTPPEDMPEKPDADYTLPPDHIPIDPDNVSDH